MSSPSFQIKDQNTIFFDGTSFPIQQQYGIDSREFISRYDTLKRKFSFSVDRFSFDSENPRGKIHIPHSYISFIYYCSALDEAGIDVANLVKQFTQAKKACDFMNIKHASSLAILAFIYHRNGKKIDFPSIKNGDLQIDGIISELKGVKSDMFRGPKAIVSNVDPKKKVKISNQILLDLLRSLKSRLQKAIKQGDMVLFDCSEMNFFGLTFFPLKTLSRIVEPAKNRIIFYETRHYLPGAKVAWGDSSGYRKPLGKIVAPDLDYFSGTFIDMDPYLWRFFSKNE